MMGLDSSAALHNAEWIEGDIRYAMKTLGGRLRHAWSAEARRLATDLLSGDWQRVPARRWPQEWQPPA